MSGSASAQDVLQLLHSFPAPNGVAGAGGGIPGPVVARTDSGPAGWALYGVASQGGLAYCSNDPTASTCPSGCGIVYKLTPPLPGDTHWALIRLYVFQGGSYNDTSLPLGRLTFDAAGSAYGVTIGGNPGSGSVFKLTPPRPGQYFWNETILHQMGSENYGEPVEGGFPESSVTLDQSGSIYGTTEGGQYDSGGVYKLTPPLSGQGPWTESFLHTFQGPYLNNSDYPAGANSGPLVVDATGAIYGLFTYQGDAGLGEVFKLTPPKARQSQWTYSTLYKPETNGYYVANTGLVRDATGTLYFTLSGGPKDAGAVLSLTPPAAGQTAWTPDFLYRFSGPDGTNPGDLSILDASGSIYGATGARVFPSSTPYSTYLGGVVFRLDPPRVGQTTWSKTVLTALPTGVAEGALTRDAAGKLYTTGGPAPANTDGTIFRLTLP